MVSIDADHTVMVANEANDLRARIAELERDKLRQVIDEAMRILGHGRSMPVKKATAALRAAWGTTS